MNPETRPEHGEGPRELRSGDTADAESRRLKRVRRRRRLRRLLVLGMLALLVFCCLLPYLFSTTAGSRIAVSAVNSYLPGKVQLRAVSLSWRGPCKISGLRLSDPDGREVARADEIVWSGGIWKVLTSPFHFEQLNLNRPELSLYIDEQGEVSLVRAITTGEKSTAEKDSAPLPDLTGKLVLSNGSMTIVQPDGRELRISRIDGDLKLDATSHATGKLVAEVAETGTVIGEIDVRELVRDGQFRPWEATGTASLSTPASLSLAPLGRFALGQPHASGSAQVQMKASFGQGEATVDTSMTLERLLVRLADSVKTEAVDMRLSGQLRATRDSMTAHAVLDGQIGDGQFEVTYPWPNGSATLSLDDIVSGALAGTPAKWPDLVVEAKSRVDLARLAQAIPALLRLHPNVVVTGGTLDVERVVFRGGDKPSTSGSLTLTKLTSRRESQVTAWEPLSLNWDARIEPTAGLQLERAAFTSGFARLTAKGSPSDLQADFQADLGRLQQQASQLIDMGGTELAGGATGNLVLKRAGQERIDLALAMGADNIRYRAGGRHTRIGKLAAKQNGYFTLAGAKVTRLTIGEATWDTDGRLAGTGSGWASIGDGAFDVGMNVTRADLAYLTEHLAGLGVPGAEGYTGEATLQAKARRSSRDAPVLSEGTAVVRNTGLRGASLLAENASLTWSDLRIPPKGDRLEIGSLELTGPPARLSATGLNIRTGDPLMVEGRFEGNGDLARCLTIGSRIAGREKPPTITGRVTFSAESRGTADGARLTGNARVDGFAINAGDATIRENQVRLAFQTGINSRQQTVAIDQLELDSQILALKMTGKISDYARTRSLDLAGDYRASWEAVLPVIRELIPATASTVTVAGLSESRFTVTGTAHQPQVYPVFTGISAATGVGWASANLYGVQMDKAMLAPVLKEGQLIVPLTTISAAGGLVRLGGEVDFRSTTPLLSLGRQLQILESIRITPELGRDLLSRVNPIFGNMTRAEGTVSLITDNIQLPLGAEIKTGGSGQGRLDLQNLRVQPTGLLMALLELGSLTAGDNYAVQVSGVDFRLQGGRLYYDQCTLAFGQDFDLRFRGSVGFDDTVNLTVSVPVRPALLDKLGVAGPTREYARLLAKARVEIPIMGTRSSPRFDLTQVDLKPLIEEATRSAVSQSTDGLLKGLLGIKQAPKTDPNTGTAGQTSPAGSQVPGRPAADQGRVIQRKALDLLERNKPSASRPTQRPLESILPVIRERAKVPTTAPASQPVRSFIRQRRP